MEEERYSVFSELPSYLEKIIVKMLKNQDIVKLLTYITPDALEKESLDVEQCASELINKKIFKHRRIDELEKEVGAKINIFFDDFRPNLKNPKFLDCLFYCKIIMHKDALNLNDSKDRIYELVKNIYKILYDSRDLGIGKLQFSDGAFYVPNNNPEYVGFQFRYKIVDFK